MLSNVKSIISARKKVQKLHFETAHRDSINAERSFSNRASIQSLSIAKQTLNSFFGADTIDTDRRQLRTISVWECRNLCSCNIAVDTFERVCYRRLVLANPKWAEIDPMTAMRIVAAQNHRKQRRIPRATMPNKWSTMCIIDSKNVSIVAQLLQEFIWARGHVERFAARCSDWAHRLKNPSWKFQINAILSAAAAASAFMMLI